MSYWPSANDAAAILQIIDNAEIWLFVVAAHLLVVLLTGIGEYQKQSPLQSGWLMLITASVGIAYYIHLYQRNEPSGLEHLYVGIRALALGFIARGIVGLGFFAVMLVWQLVTSILHNLVGRPCSKIHRGYASYRERRDERIEAEREDRNRLTPEELEELNDAHFEKGIMDARRRFDRWCHIIDQEEGLSDMERNAAIMKARAMMTREIADVMNEFG